MKKITDFFRGLAIAISKETAALAWTLGGTGLVLITLSGQTQRIAIYITIASAVLHFAGVLIPRESTNDEPEEGDDK
jgi:hypothetical protein